MLWIGLYHLPQDGLKEDPTTAPCRIVDQLDTAQTVDLERGYKGKRYCGPGAAPQISDLSRGSREATDFAIGEVAACQRSPFAFSQRGFFDRRHPPDLRGDFFL